MPKRDDFSEMIKRGIAQRARNQCSNPKCRASTSGPHTEDDKAINVGVAAHITAAAAGGPRYDSSLTAVHRSSASNAIWLCQTCAKLIDSDVVQFSKEILIGWKLEAEERARERLGKAEATRDAILANDMCFANILDSSGSPPTSSAALPAVPQERLAHLGVRDAFVGRLEELQKLKNILLPSDGSPLATAIATIQGMPGVGKSYLVDRFAYVCRDSFLGGYYTLALDPCGASAAESLGGRLATLVGQRRWGDDCAWTELRTRLCSPRSLIHIENIDSYETALSAVAFARRLLGCALIFSGRSRHLGQTQEFRRIELNPFDEPTALGQLELTLGPGNIDERRRLAKVLGYLPLALHLAAGHLSDGHSIDGFLCLLHSRGLDLAPAGADDPLLQSDRNRAVLSGTFELSLALLRKRLGTQADAGLAGLTVLGYAPPVGVGRSAGAAMAGLDETAFELLMVEATRLSVANRSVNMKWNVHPLLAEFLRSREIHHGWFVRTIKWLIARISDRSLWRDVHEESAVLDLCLRELIAQGPENLDVTPEHLLREFVNAGAFYALTNGPFHVWTEVFQKWLTKAPPVEHSNILWILAKLAKQSGQNKECRLLSEQKLIMDRENGDEFGYALAHGMIAQLSVDDGDLKGGLRILEEEVVPVYERLGEKAQCAIAKTRIAGIYRSLGNTDIALGLYEALLPIFKQLNDEDSWCKTRGHIADIYSSEGRLDDALDIYTNDMLPVHARLGDLHATAMTEGRIAGIFLMRGLHGNALIKYAEGMRIFRELGDAYHEAVFQFDIGDVYRYMGELEQALAVFHGLGSTFDRLGHGRVTATVYGRIAVILQEMGRLQEALRVHQEEEIPLLTKLGNLNGLAFAKGNVANIYFRMGDINRALSIYREEVLPAFEARRDFVNATHAKVLFARVLAASGALPQAVTLLRECISFYSQIGATADRDSAARLLEEVKQGMLSLPGLRTPRVSAQDRKRRRRRGKK
ncbi:hypothetical protein [Nannocystis radixulma]|uniref:Tetratricopeptide repeat protein n=1 Tax=Nannocystis radixulma TaxID=2995305 RepID=A0ABT5B6Q6_9BACT|nr:hypothetical protein [Nannocystis radixulma]MDC0669782.1 hypothetical protein [Nannocystis radixulma]